MNLFTVLRNIYLKIQKNINVERITNSEIDDAFGEAAGTGTDAQDYVVEHGTSGNWIYRKYASGIAECWGRHQYTTTEWKAWGGIYEALPQQSVNYPSGLFTSVNSCNIFPNGIGAITLAGVEVSGNSGGSTTRTPYFYATRGATSTNNTVGVSIHAIGRWKEN